MLVDFRQGVISRIPLVRIWDISYTIMIPEA